MRKSQGIPFSIWLSTDTMDSRDLIKYIPLVVWSEGYLDNLTLKETERRYNEKGHGNTN